MPEIVLDVNTAFAEHWRPLFAAHVDMGDRIFLDLDLMSCDYVCPLDAQARLPAYLENLDVSFKYFAVTGVDRGLHSWNVTVPAQLDLLVFATCGTTTGARNIPLPALPVTQLIQKVSNPYLASVENM